jgi:hypothetical protein
VTGIVSHGDSRIPPEVSTIAVFMADPPMSTPSASDIRPYYGLNMLVVNLKKQPPIFS